MRASWRWRSEKSAVQVRLRGRNSRLRYGNFGLRLRDPSECAVDFGLLQLFLAPVILDGGFCRCHARIRLGYLRLEIAVLQFEQQVTFVSPAGSQRRVLC